MEEIVLTKSAEETQKFAEDFARSLLLPHDKERPYQAIAVLLYGNLGAGKTTFVQGFAKGLGIQKRIISPTFIILRTYKIPDPVIASKGKPSTIRYLAKPSTIRYLAKPSTIRYLAKQSGSNDEIATSSASGETPRNDVKLKSFYHVDLYRLQSEKEIEGLGLLELMQNPENIIVIEWPERLGSLRPKKRWELKFKAADENEREIRIQKFTI